MARSLTKTTLAGKKYDQNDHRGEIDEALKQDQATLIRRSQVTESSSPEFMTPECLVALIRNAICSEIPTTYNPLIMILFSRCQAILESKIPNSFPDNENIREKVMDAFIDLVGLDCSNQSKGHLDFYECRFNLVFRNLTFDVMRIYKTRKIKSVTLPELTDGSNEEPALWNDKALQTPASHADQMEYAEFLDALPDEEREAVVLHYVIGHKIESIDKDETTVATLCGVSGRTIRARLKGAEERILQLKLEDK